MTRRDVSTHPKGLPWPEIHAAMRFYAGVSDNGHSRVDVEPLQGWLSTGSIYHATVSSGQAPSAHFLVKRSPYARLEARWLSTINQRLDTAGIIGTVPKLIADFNEHDTIVTDYRTGGENLGAAVIRAALPYSRNSRRAPVLDFSRALGEWLGRFHVAVRNGEFLLSSIQDDLDARIQELASLGFVQARRLQAAISAEFERLGPVPAVLSHGDFAPRNVLMVGEDVHVVDWEMVPKQPMPFLLDLIHCLAVIRKRHPLLRPTIQNRIGGALTAGYFANAPFPKWMTRAWRPVQLLTLTILLSRQVRAVRRSPIRARLTGKKAFVQQLTKEISCELERN